MGASSFSDKVEGKTAKDAFRAAVDQARYDHGHSGYSGSIAEKDSFIMIDVPKGQDPIEYSYSDEALNKVADKWGPAGCIALGNNEWLFFGYASS